MEQSNGDFGHQGEGEQWNQENQAGYSFTGSSPGVAHGPLSIHHVNSSVMNHSIGSPGAPGPLSIHHVNSFGMNHLIGSPGAPGPLSNYPVSQLPSGQGDSLDFVQGGAGQDDAPRNDIDATTQNISGAVVHHAPSDLGECEHQGGDFYKWRGPNNYYFGYRRDGEAPAPCCNDLRNGTTSQAMANHLGMHIREERRALDKRSRETVALQPQQGEEEEEELEVASQEPSAKRNRPNPRVQTGAVPNQPLGPAPTHPAGGVNPVLGHTSRGQPHFPSLFLGAQAGPRASAPLPRSHAHHGGQHAGATHPQESLDNYLALDHVMERLVDRLMDRLMDQRMKDRVMERMMDRMMARMLEEAETAVGN